MRSCARLYRDAAVRDGLRQGVHAACIVGAIVAGFVACGEIDPPITAWALRYNAAGALVGLALAWLAWRMR